MAARKFTDAQGEQALLAHYGNVSAAAAALGVAHSTLWERIGKSERLQAARVEAEERTLDLAEAALVEGVRRGDAWAVCFMLKTRGKRRGYTTRQDVTLANGENPFVLKLVDPTCIPGSEKLDYDPDAPDARWGGPASAPEPELAVEAPERPRSGRLEPDAAQAIRPEQRPRRPANAEVEAAIRRNWQASGRRSTFEV